MFMMMMLLMIDRSITVEGSAVCPQLYKQSNLGSCNITVPLCVGSVPLSVSAWAVQCAVPVSADGENRTGSAGAHRTEKALQGPTSALSNKLPPHQIIDRKCCKENTYIQDTDVL